MGEQQYLDFMRDILEHGEKKSSRAGDTLSLYGKLLEVPLMNSADEPIIPLLTTKKMSYRLIVEELLWFLSGSTDSKVLAERNVHIWDANGSRENLDKLGFTNRAEGELGPIYGYQWRNYNNEHCDQIANAITLLRNDPYSRRNLVLAWNPVQLREMVLPPCHVMFGLSASPDKQGQPAYLDCAVVQRSADVPLGLPFNIASYGTLAHMFAQQAGLSARKLSHFVMDAHIYINQIEGCQDQLKRAPSVWPTLRLEYAPNIFEYKWGNFKLENYSPQDTITFPFSI